MSNVTYTLGRMFGRIDEPDSAYRRLIDEMENAEGGFLWTPAEAKELVDAVLDEAAERIRSEEAPEEREDTFDAGAVWAAELIRPTPAEDTPGTAS